jgi:hypothetical protein
MNNATMKLDRMAYDARRVRHVPYSLFDAYEKRLRKRHAYDHADR